MVESSSPSNGNNTCLNMVLNMSEYHLEPMPRMDGWKESILLSSMESAHCSLKLDSLQSSGHCKNFAKHNLVKFSVTNNGLEQFDSAESTTPLPTIPGSNLESNDPLDDEQIPIIDLQNLKNAKNPPNQQIRNITLGEPYEQGVILRMNYYCMDIWLLPTTPQTFQIPINKRETQVRGSNGNLPLMRNLPRWTSTVFGLLWTDSQA